MKRLLLALLLTVVSLSGTRDAFALEIPPKPTAWVTDRAGVLDAGQLQALNQKLEDFAQRSGSQILVMIYPSLGEEQLEDYTIRVAEQWKTNKDRAAILFIFLQERKVRFEVGYGLEGAMPDAFVGRVIREQMAPRFQQNDYAGGIGAGLDAAIARVEGKEQAIAHDTPRGGGGQGAPVSGLGISPGTLILLAVIFFFVILPMFRRGGRGGCGCLPLFFPFGGSGMTFGGGGGGFGGGGGGWGVGGGWGGGGGGSFGGGGASGGW